MFGGNKGVKNDFFISAELLSSAKTSAKSHRTLGVVVGAESLGVVGAEPSGVIAAAESLGVVAGAEAAFGAGLGQHMVQGQQGGAHHGRHVDDPHPGLRGLGRQA